MKYLIIALAIAAVLIVIRGAGGDDQPQVAGKIIWPQSELQGPSMARLVLVPDGDAVPFVSPLRGVVGGHWERI